MENKRNQFSLTSPSRASESRYTLNTVKLNLKLSLGNEHTLDSVSLRLKLNTQHCDTLALPVGHLAQACSVLLLPHFSAPIVLKLPCLSGFPTPLPNCLALSCSLTDRERLKYSHYPPHNTNQPETTGHQKRLSAAHVRPKQARGFRFFPRTATWRQRVGYFPPRIHIPTAHRNGAQAHGGNEGVIFPQGYFPPFLWLAAFTRSESSAALR